MAKDSKLMSTAKRFVKGGGAKRKKKGGKVEKVMGEWKRGTLHSGSKHGPIVKRHDVAVAIALSEARKHGEKV
jgi:Family of unknown function (DUF6496)